MITRFQSRTLKRTAMASNGRKTPYVMLLLLALAAALLSVVVLQKQRERRVSGVLLQDQEQELIVVQHLLEKEKEHSKEMKSRLKNLKEKTISLITEKAELNNKLMETETTVNKLNRMKQEMEVVLQEKENQINRMTEKATEPTILNLQVDGLTTLLKQKDTEIDEMKHQLNLAEENLAKDNAALNYSKGNERPHNDSPEKITLLSNKDTSKKEVEAKSVNETANAHEGAEEGKWVQFRTNIVDEESREQSETSNKDVEVERANETANTHEGTEEGKWVQFRTNVENEESKDQSESNSNRDTSDFSKENQLEKLEISEEIEIPKKREAGKDNMVDFGEQKEDLKDAQDADPTGDRQDTRTEWTSSNKERNMQLHKDGDSKKHSESHVVYEQNTSTDLNSSEETDRTKTKVKHGKKIKRRGKRHYSVLKTEMPRISENQMTSGNVDSSTVTSDNKGASVYSDQPQTTGGGGSQNSN